MPPASVVILSVVYVLAWSAIPVLEKLALRTDEQHALTWCVFALGFVFMSTYVLVFTEHPRDKLGEALYCGWIWGSGGLTTAVYITYFELLQANGVIYIVMLQPLLLIGQAGLSVLVFKDQVDAWNVAGMLVVLVGMVLYNGGQLVKKTQPPPQVLANRTTLVLTS